VTSIPLISIAGYCASFFKSIVKSRLEKRLHQMPYREMDSKQKGQMYRTRGSSEK